MEPAHVFMGILGLGTIYALGNLNIILLILYHTIGGICLFTGILFALRISLLDTGYRLLDPFQDYLDLVARACASLASYI